MPLGRSVTFVVLVALLIGPAWANGNAHVLLGPRSHSDEFWDSFDDQGGSGFVVDFGLESWPVHVVLGVLAGNNEGIDAPLAEPIIDILEYSVGVVSYFRQNKSGRPFAGGGLTALTAEIDISSSSTDDEDDTSGLYLNAGVVWRRGKRVTKVFGAGRLFLCHPWRRPARSG